MRGHPDRQADLTNRTAGSASSPPGGRPPRIRTGVVLALAASLALSACATTGRRPESTGGRPVVLDEFVAYLKKAYEDLRGALTSPGPGESRGGTPKSPAEEPLAVATAGQALERGDYSTALTDLDRVLAAQPQHREAIELKQAVLYRFGRAQVDEGRYADAYRTLVQLARLAPGYEDSTAVLRSVRDRLVQQHYREGLRLFADERVEAAIAQWRIALEYDPQHANARRNLERAERILRGLEQRRGEQRVERLELMRTRAQPARGGDGT